MSPKDDLEKYIDFGLSGSYQIKGAEKRYWLGEFRERIVFALKKEQIHRKEAMKILEEKLKDSRVARVVVHNGISDILAGKYMDLAGKYKKDFKMIDMQNKNQEIALVLASDDAVYEENVLIDQLPVLPDRFYNAKNNKLCKSHMEELEKIAPMFKDEFEEISLFDKLIGINCGVCKNNEKSGPLV